MPNVERRIVREESGVTDGDRVVLRTDDMNVFARDFTGDPLTLA